MKTVNIYITKQEKAKADRITKKNFISLSCLTDIVCYWLFYVMHHYGKKEDLDKMLNTYLTEETNYKTSIKPKFNGEYLGQIIEHKSRFCTNALKIYLNKEIHKYITDEKAKAKYYNKIDQQIQTTKETMWNYNAVIRMQRRSLRENKEYFRKALETV